MTKVLVITAEARSHRRGDPTGSALPSPDAGIRASNSSGRSPRPTTASHMMRTFLPVILVASCLVGVSACGGGGSSDPSAPVTGPVSQGVGGGGGSQPPPPPVTGSIPPALVGTWKVDLSIPVGDISGFGAGQCGNGEVISLEYVRALTIAANGSADFSTTTFDNGVSDGCNPNTLGTCNTERDFDFPSASVSEDSTTLEITLNRGVETFSSLCHPAQNFSGAFTGPVIKTRYFITQSPTTGRTALKVDGPPFEVVCWTGVDETTGQPTGNSCPIIYLEKVQ